MIREIVGAKTMASIFTPKRRKKRTMMPSVSTLGVLAGAGIVYMSMRKRNNQVAEEEQ